MYVQSALVKLWHSSCANLFPWMYLCIIPRDDATFSARCLERKLAVPLGMCVSPNLYSKLQQLLLLVYSTEKVSSASAHVSRSIYIITGSGCVLRNICLASWYLIFVTGSTGGACGDKSVMLRKAPHDKLLCGKSFPHGRLSSASWIVEGKLTQLLPSYGVSTLLKNFAAKKCDKHCDGTKQHFK